MPSGRRAPSPGTGALSVVMVVIGVAIVVSTIARGGGPLAVGIILGAAVRGGGRAAACI